MPGPRRGRQTAALHAGSIFFFALLSLLFTWPLAAHRADAVLGGGAGDNLGALWNIWWARSAIMGPASFFWTPALFAPLGTSLVLHSYAPLESAAAALVPATTVGAYNLALLAGVFLNLACAYWAAWAITRDVPASCFAAIAFGGAPFLLVRLHGHMNVLNAWGLPLLLLAIRRYQRTATVGSAALLALAWAVLVYTDAYFAIFGMVVAIVYVAISRWPVRVEGQPITPGRRRLLAFIVPLAVVIGAVIVWIEATGGTDTAVAGIRLRMTDTFNPRVILGFLLLAAGLAWNGPAVRLDPLSTRGDRRVVKMLPVVLTISAVLIAPMVVAALQLWRAGDYESQVYFWRSAPPGIDLAALVLGNPLGHLTGPWSSAVYDRLGIDRSESTVWVGLATLAVVLAGYRRWRSDAEARRLAWVGTIFFAWSLGPYLRAFGYNTAFMLPQTLLRFVPVVANARIPGRAFVVVLLMMSLVAAIAIATIADPRRRHRVALVAIAVLILDFWPVPHPTLAADRPQIYETLRRQPPGIVLEIPTGWRDGFGQRGGLDHRVLLYQTDHQHPQIGGFIARLSSRIKRAYDADPVLGPILDLSEGRAIAGAGKAGPAGVTGTAPCGLTCDVRYLVIDEERASSELETFVANTFKLRLLDRSGGRALYAVD